MPRQYNLNDFNLGKSERQESPLTTPEKKSRRQYNLNDFNFETDQGSIGKRDKSGYTSTIPALIRSGLSAVAGLNENVGGGIEYLGETPERRRQVVKDALLTLLRKGAPKPGTEREPYPTPEHWTWGKLAEAAASDIAGGVSDVTKWVKNTDPVKELAVWKAENVLKRATGKIPTADIIEKVFSTIYPYPLKAGLLPSKVESEAKNQINNYLKTGDRESLKKAQELLEQGKGFGDKSWVEKSIAEPIASAGRTYAKEFKKAAEWIRPNVKPGSLLYYSTGAIEGVLPSLGTGILTTLITKNPELGLAAMYPSVFGQVYHEQRAKGKSTTESAQTAGFYAATEVLSEMIPLGILTKEGGKFVTRVFKSATAEGLQEAINEAMQIAYDEGIINEHTPPEQIGRRLIDAGIMGAVGGGGTATFLHPFIKKRDDKSAAKLKKEFIDSIIINGAGETKQESVDAFQKGFVQNLFNETDIERIKKGAPEIADEISRIVEAGGSESERLENKRKGVLKAIRKDLLSGAITTAHIDILKDQYPTLKSELNDILSEHTRIQAERRIQDAKETGRKIETPSGQKGTSWEKEEGVHLRDVEKDRMETPGGETREKEEREPREKEVKPAVQTKEQGEEPLEDSALSAPPETDESLREAKKKPEPPPTSEQNMPVEGKKPSFDEMVSEARKWKGAAIKADRLYPETDKKGRLKHSNMTTKGALDTYLIQKFGIDEITARDVSNELTKQDLKPDMSAKVEDFADTEWGKAALDVDKSLTKQEKETKPKTAEGKNKVVEAKTKVEGKEEVPSTNKIGQESIENLNIDAPRFQYKRFLGNKGVSSKLKHIKHYNPELGGIISVWRNPADNKLYVINGHHRYELAKRTGQKDLTVRYLEAKNAEEAKLKGALINIAENQGTPEDAALIFRQNDITPETISELYGISLKGKVAEEGMALAGLEPGIFHKIEIGELPRNWGIAIGEKLRGDFGAQKELLALLKKKGAKHNINVGVIEQIIDDIQNAGKTTETQTSLFGDEIKTRPLLIERAELRDYVLNKLLSDKRLFGTVSKEVEAERLSKAGNVIEAKENRKLSEEAGQLASTFIKLANYAGPINDTINKYAEKLSNATNKQERDDTKREFYDAVRDSIQREVPGIQKEVSKGAERHGEGREPDTGDTKGGEPSSEADEIKTEGIKDGDIKYHTLSVKEAKDEFKFEREDFEFEQQSFDFSQSPETISKTRRPRKRMATRNKSKPKRQYIKSEQQNFDFSRPAKTVPKARRPRIRMATTGYIASDGNIVRNTEDAAALLASIRKSAQEFCYGITTDKDGVVLEIHKYTKGLIDQSQLRPVEYVGHVLTMPGAESFYFVHNHPSGGTEPSAADYAIRDKIEGLLKLNDIKIHALIIGDTKYIDFTSNVKGKKALPIRPTIRKVSLPVKERKITKRGAGLKIQSSADVETYLNKSGNKYKDGFILLDTAHQVIEFIPYPKGETPLKAAAKLVSRFDMSGVSATIFNSPNKRVFGGARQKFLQNLHLMIGDGVALLDIIDRGRSMADQNTLKFAMPYPKKMTRHDYEGAIAELKAQPPLYKKRKTAEAKGKFKAKDLQSEVDEITARWKNAPPVKVVQSQSELSERILSGAAEDDIIDAVYDNGKVIIVADNMASIEDTVRALMHESFGHHGLRKSLGLEFEKIMEDVYEAKPAEIQKVADNYEYDTNTREGRILSAEEWLAREAVNNPTSKWVRKVMRAIRRFARRLLPSLRLSMDEITQILEDARHYVERGITSDRVGINQMAGKKAIGNEGMPLFQMAGEKAIGADKGALQKAQKMLAEGVDKKKVWKETGWLKGAEGKWKFEIDDSGAGINDLGLKPKRLTVEGGKFKDYEQAYEGSLAGIYVHPVLFRMYPKLEHITTVIAINPKLYDGRGHYNDRENEIVIDAPNLKEANKALIHEIQHAIQKIEGFARGGQPTAKRSITIEKAAMALNKVWINMPREIKRQVKDAYRKANKQRMPSFLNRYGNRISREILDDLADAIDFFPKKYFNEIEKALDALDDAFYDKYGFGINKEIEEYKQYEKLAGEIEARDTSARSKLTTKQRREQFPYESQGIPEDQWIVRDGDGTSFSIERSKKETHEVKNLTTEALKYETAEEFVDAQKKVYHGGAGIEALEKKFDILTPEQKQKLPSSAVGLTGLSMTPNKKIALDYSANIGQTDKVFEAYINPDAKILKIDTKGKGVDVFYTDNKINDLIKQGYDAIQDIGKEAESEYRALTPKAIKTKAQLTDIWNKAQEERKAYQSDIRYGKVHRDDSIPQIREANPEALEELRKSVYEWLKDVLPKSVLKRINVSLTPHISHKGKNTKLSEEQWAEIHEQPGEIMGAATTNVLHSFIELSYNFDNDTIQKNTYHEAFHVAARWLLPDADYKQMIDYFNGNEEAAANAFMNFAKRMKENKVRQPFIKRIFRKLRLIFKRIRNGLRGKGFKTPEDVFEKLWGKEYDLLPEKKRAERVAGKKINEDIRYQVSAGDLVSPEGGVKQIESIQDLKLFTDKHPGLFIRWSKSPDLDIKQKVSTDKVTGEQHAGLSAVEIEDWSPGRLAERIKEYSFLRLNNPGIKGWLYEGVKVGVDSDGYPVIKPTKAVAVLSDSLVESLDRGEGKRLRIEEDIQYAKDRLNSVTDSIAKKIWQDEISKLEKELSSLPKPLRPSSEEGYPSTQFSMAPKETPEEWAKRIMRELEEPTKVTPERKGIIAKAIMESKSPPMTTARAIYTRHFNDAMYWIVDKNRPIHTVQKLLGNITDDIDVFLKETLRPKRTAAKIKTVWTDEIQPLIEKMSEYKINVPELEVYMHALHAPEANKALRHSNAKLQVEKIIKVLELNKERTKASAIKEDIKGLKTPSEWYKALNNIIKQYGTEKSLQNILAKWKAFAEKPSGMTDKEANNILLQYKGNKKIKTLGRMLDSINNNSLALLFNSGALAEEEYTAILNKYKHYVPLYREGFDDRIFGATKGLKPSGRPIKIRGGSTRDVVNILAHSIANYEKAINIAEKARSQRALRDLIEANPESDVINIEAVKKSKRYDSHGNLRMYPDLFNVNDNEMRLMVDGKQYLVSVQRDNKDAMLMMRTLKAEDGMNGPIMNYLAKLNRFLAKVNTSWSPEFIISNFIRDMQTAGINIQDTGIKGKGMLRGIKDAWRAIYAIERGNPKGTELEGYYKRFKEAGGKIGWSDVHGSVDNIGKKITNELKMMNGERPGRKRIKQWMQLIEDINTSIENGIRLQAFKLAVDQGETDERAAQIASDLTVDFTKKGAAGPVINSLYLFANAGIQGTYRIFRAGAKSPKVRKTMAEIAGAGFIIGILNALAGGEDDDGEDYFNKIDDYIRERNMIIMLPGTKGKYIKIPLPWGYNVFWNIGIEASRAFTKENYSCLSGAGRLSSTFANAFNPIAAGTLLQTLSPTVADPFIQVGENKNWFGGELMPERDKFDKTPDPDSQRYWKSVGIVSKWVTSQLNSITGGDKIKRGLIDVSPETLDLIVDTIGGSAFRFVKDTLGLPINIFREEVEIHKIPFVRRVAGEKTEWADSRIYYKNIENVLVAKERLKAYRGTDSYAKLFKSLRAERLLIPLADISEKRLRALRKGLKRAKVSGNNVAIKKWEDRINQVYIYFNKKYNKVMRQSD